MLSLQRRAEVGDRAGGGEFGVATSAVFRWRVEFWPDHPERALAQDGFGR